ncbi:Scd6-like-Sm domain protein (macronuclear) [Tetrahymena thermophila SB210]|uniref:Scd6-like-Sm domain protein n=1 Tax=Tetrahymena thermophila (strain SB210) TaxID=312017 RepID=I7M235_TETTS|nr:Scd6-like-Sm domain protein [Tetrahymena thermophila SB210]EAR98403.2 Scd6-like-Sm domain protein [Tetrahymena thermophila SB210]|eukprot:XP_001018648.2 Scd6-like-Sm domain protein [Tetrahymena thermophila SB210]
MIEFLSNIMSNKGQRISIVSQFDIRYEGILYSISNDHVVLKDVKNFGYYHVNNFKNINQYQEQDKLIIKISHIKDVMPIEDVILRKIVKVNKQDISIINSRGSVPQLPEIRLSQYETRRNTEESQNNNFVNVSLNQSMFIEQNRSRQSSSLQRDRYSQFTIKDPITNLKSNNKHYKRNLASSQLGRKTPNSPSRYFVKSEITPFDISLFVKKNIEDCQNYNFLTQQQQKQAQAQKYFIKRRYY